MTDAAVLFVKPKAIRPCDKGALRKAGIIVVEIDNPSDARFVRSETELPNGDLLQAAGKAIMTSNIAQKAFGAAIAAAVQKNPTQ